MGQTKRARRSGFWQAVTLAVAAGLILFIGWGYSQETKAAKAYTPNNLIRTSPDALPADKPETMSTDQVVRLHIKANSNGPADQSVKESVRDAIMGSFGESLLGISDVKEAEKVLTKALPKIEDVASKCLEENGFSYGAKATIKMADFPDKSYELAAGKLVYLPAGEYKALVVYLGAGDGDNWWCVMYPPLCYLDLVQRAVLKQGGQNGSVSGKQAVAIIDELATKDVPVEVRSLLLDSIKAGLSRLSDILANIEAKVLSANNNP